VIEPARICAELDTVLEVGRFKDASLNGLQIDAGRPVERIVTGVSANLALLDKAVKKEAQLVVVHHGLLWGQSGRLTGLFGARVRAFYAEGVSLAGYHLPLDAHPTLGNNAGLADLLELGERVGFGVYQGQSIGVGGELPTACPFGEIADMLSERLGGLSHAFGDRHQPVRRVALSSGASGDMIEQAAAEGYDLFLTGEAEEWSQAQARELGIGMIAGGHHRTERFGPRALARYLSEELGHQAEFVDVPNPV
jgi:dinuclear metal center YbgI/SA1388 family protein